MKPYSLLLLALVACGDDGARQLADAPLFDVPPDHDAATSGVVSLTVTSQNAPIEGVDVYFQNADSSLVAKVPTNADGIAMTTMEPGGYVTAIDPFPSRGKGVPAGGDLRVFAGVKPGDQLRLDDGNAGSSSAVTMTFTAPIEDDASTYELFTSCGTQHTMTGPDGSGSVPTTTFTLYGCASIVDALVQTTHFDGTTRTHLYAPAVTLTEGATVAITGTYTTTPDVTYTLASVPAAFTTLSLRAVLATTRGKLIDQYYYGLQVTGGTATQALARPLVTGSLSLTRTELTDGELTRHSVIDWGAPSAAMTIDLAGALLPAYATSPAYVAASRRIEWTVAATGAQPDLAYVYLFASRPDQSGWRFQVVAPYTTAAIQLPTLPPEIERYNLIADDDVYIYDLVTGKVPGGYDAVRAQGLNIDFYGGDALAVGATGRASLAHQTSFLVTRSSGAPAAGRRGAPITAR